MSLKKCLMVLAFLLIALAPWACGGSGYSSPTAPKNVSTPGPGPTPTATRY